MYNGTTIRRLRIGQTWPRIHPSFVRYPAAPKATLMHMEEISEDHFLGKEIECEEWLASLKTY